MSNYNYQTLCHHGIKGQKWGIRRYQNEDGSLTAEGRKRYDVAPSGEMTESGKKLYLKDKKQDKWSKEDKANTKKRVAIGAGIGAAVGIASAAKGIWDYRDGGPGAVQLAGQAGIITALLSTVGGITIGGVSGQIRNSRIEKGKNYVNSILSRDKSKERQPWDEKPTRPQGNI